MTALHQFGAEMLKLSKRLESYPTASPKQTLPPSPLLIQPRAPSNGISSSDTTHVTNQRLIRSTTNASIVTRRRPNTPDEVGDDTSVHYNTRADCRADTHVDYAIAVKSSPPAPSETISVKQHGYIFGTCNQALLPDPKLFMTFPRISTNSTSG